MSDVNVSEVREFVLEQLDTVLVEGGVDRASIDDRTDLLEEAILDSMRVVQLLALVEDHYDLETDWDDYDPEDILVIGPFCEYVARCASSSG